MRPAGPTRLAVLLLVLVSCAAPADPPPGARPVLFVPGYGEDPGVFDTMLEHLRGRGWPADQLLAVQLDPVDGSNVAAAEGAVSDGVDRLLAAVGGGRVDIVAHSMGAVSSRWYAAELHPERVRSLTTVVGANHGTDVLCGHAGAGAAEMCPAFGDGPVQAGLNGAPGAPLDETPHGRGPDPAAVVPVPADPDRAIRYTAVALPVDAWIQPVSSAALAGADPVTGLPDGVVDQPSPGNLVFTGSADHDAILHADGMLDVLDAVLAAAAR